MKIKYPFIVVLILSLFSCQHNMEDQDKTANNIVDSGNIDNIYNEMLTKQSQISLIKYNVRRVDTFDVKNVWDNKGTATLQRHSNDTIFGFSFYGKRDDIARENFYIENRHFQVYNEDKTYRIETNYGPHTLGAPGGQMVVVDLLNLEYYQGELSIELCDSGNFLLTKRQVSSDSTVTTRQIYIDRSTLLPYKIHKRTANNELGLKQTTTFYISTIKTNGQVVKNELSEMDFLSEYQQKQIAIDKSADEILNKKVHDIVLYTFNGDSLELNDIKSKVVLLDFWELWCGPCRQALPKIEEISTRFTTEDLFIIGVISENIEGAKKLVANEGITFTQAAGNQELKLKFMVNSFPRYILIDQNRIIKKIYYGYSDIIESDIRNIL